MHENLKTTLLTDVETVANTATFEELDAEWQKLWGKQCKQTYQDRLDKGQTVAEIYTDRAGLHPEFSRIACIVMGYLTGVDGAVTLRVKPIFDKSEAEILTEFSVASNKFKRVCAYNGKKFDFPFICRRSVINRIPVPGLLNNWGKKPWEVENIDPMELWQFGGFSFPSMDLLCKNLDIPLKSIMDGSEVHNVYHIEKDYQKIARYCAGDVIALAHLLLRLTDPATEIADVVLA